MLLYQLVWGSSLILLGLTKLPFESFMNCRGCQEAIKFQKMEGRSLKLSQFSITRCIMYVINTVGAIIVGKTIFLPEL